MSLKKQKPKKETQKEKKKDTKKVAIAKKRSEFFRRERLQK
jgi:hypothetical protein